MASGDNVSSLVNDAGYLTDATLPDSPVISVNGQTGAVSLSASDVGAVSTTGQAADSALLAGQVPSYYNDYNNLINVPPIGAAPGNGTITIVQPGTTNQTFTVNQNGDTTITLKNDNTTYTVGNGVITLVSYGQGAGANSTFSTNQTGNETITLPQIRYSDLSGQPTIGNGTITLRSYGHNANFSSTFSVNQTGSETITMPQIRYGDLSGLPTIGNGQINVNASTGLSISGSNATANQTGNTTRTLSLNTSYTDGRYLRLSGGINALGFLP